MDILLNWLWQGAVVALALAGALRLLDGVRAQTRYGLCWAALALILALPVVAAVSSGSVDGARAPAAPGAGAMVEVPETWWTSPALAAMLWGGWAGVLLCRLGYAVRRVRQVRRRSRLFPADAERRLPAWMRLRGCGRRAVLVLSDDVAAAAVLGIGRPVIAVSPALLQRLDAADLDRVVVHEWAHVQRRDDIAFGVQMGIGVVAGWHPAVWWLGLRLHAERERACDELAVGMTGSPARYARSLVRVAELVQPPRDALAALGALSSTGLADRVTRIVAGGMSRRPARLGAAIMVAALGATAFGAAGVRMIATERVAADAGAPAREGPVVAGGRRTGARADVRAGDPGAGAPAAGSSEFAAGQVRRETLVATSRAALPVPSRTVAMMSTAPQAPARAESEAGRAEAIAPPEEQPVGVAAGGTGDEPLAAAGPPAEGASDALPSRAAWAATAEAGAAIGRGSAAAGVATAGFFDRLGRRMAGAVTP